MMGRKCLFIFCLSRLLHAFHYCQPSIFLGMQANAA